MNALFILAAAGFVVIFILVSIAAKKAREQRLAELGTFAAQTGLTLYPDGISSSGGGWLSSFEDSEAGRLVAPYGNMHPFGAQQERSVNMLLTGPHGPAQWAIFEYSYVTESTTTDSQGNTQTSRTTHSFTVHAAQISLNLPWIEIRREGFFDKIGKAFGGQDMNFELEAFNRRYRVQSSDPRTASGLIHPKAIEYLMSIPDRHWQMGGSYILIVESDTCPVPEIGVIMSEIEGFVNLIPGYLQQDLSGRTQ